MNSNLFKKIGLVLAAIFILIQFIHPAKNEGESYGPNDISKSLTVPEFVQGSLEKSCYDCHSNRTIYPWYANIQPVGFWLKDHVDEGKRELNFSEFNTYKTKRKIKKLKEIAEQLEENEMPLFSYTLIHRDAVLSEAQKGEIIAWAKEGMRLLADTLNVPSPIDVATPSESHEEHEHHD